MSSNRQSPVQTALIWHFPKKSAQFRFFLPEIRPPQTFQRISPYPQKNAFLRITLALPAATVKLLLLQFESVKCLILRDLKQLTDFFYLS